MRPAASFTTDLASRGRHHFTTAEVTQALGASLPAVRAALRRLKHHGEIADPHRGFFVIVPPEYRRLGCLPPEQFVPALMEHLGEPYYVALLSAAELHGAAHHRPQGFQVMVEKNRRALECGQVRVQFVARHDLAMVPTVAMNTPRGRMIVSSPEATALDLVGYAEQAGGLDNVALVLADLAEQLDAAKLRAAAGLCPIAWSQRLGYLLDLAGHQDLAEALIEEVRDRASVVAPLIRKKPITGASRSERWRLAINAAVEADL